MNLDMVPLPIFLFVGLILLVVTVALVRRIFDGVPDEDVNDFPYSRLSGLFTPAERSFLGVLDQAIGDRYRVLGKVRIADAIVVKGAKDASARGRAFNKISAKHFDFLLCEPSDLSIVCAIELDDGSHSKSNRVVRDEFVVRACAAAKLPLARFPAKKGYTLDDVRQGIDRVIPLFTQNDAPRRALITVASFTSHESELPSFSAVVDELSRRSSE